MSRVYQNLGLSPEASALTVVRTAIRRLHPDTLAVRSWREARKRYYRELLQAHAAAQATAETPSPPKRADLPPLATHFDPTDGASGFSF